MQAEKLPENKQGSMQKYYMEDDDDRQIFIARREWRRGSRVLEKQTGRYRVYITDGDGD